MNTSRIVDWIKNDPMRWALLGYVRELALPDCWIGAGFVRNAVWRILHDMPSALTGDVDVIWFDVSDASEARDQSLEAQLRIASPGIDWSVNNQARMHHGNGDAAYLSTEDAMRFWPETATAVAVRRTSTNDCELVAPLGLDDLLELKLRPAGDFAHRKRAIFEKRVREKRWLQEFSCLKLIG
ncbi:MAG: hypothetical protein JWQ16_1859 [Novosphingobium sp.]|nr:hypothetical protein [Novosphingobium sp.]